MREDPASQAFQHHSHADGQSRRSPSYDRGIRRQAQRMESPAPPRDQKNRDPQQGRQEMNDSTRRQFLHTALAAGAGLAALHRASAIEPIKREAKSAHFKLSLPAYSFNRHMALNAKAEPTLTMDGFAYFAVGIGLDAIEPTAYYFPAPTREYFTMFRRRCTRLGLDVSGTAIGNDFCKTDPAELRKQIDSTKQWIENASWIGAKTIRIFAGSVARGDTEEKALPRCIEAIEE